MYFKLDVPFRQKDRAKEYGARWDSVGKTWYFEGKELPAGLARWYFPRPLADSAGSGAVRRGTLKGGDCGDPEAVLPAGDGDPEAVLPAGDGGPETVMPACDHAPDPNAVTRISDSRTGAGNLFSGSGNNGGVSYGSDITGVKTAAVLFSGSETTCGLFPGSETTCGLFPGSDNSGDAAPYDIAEKYSSVTEVNEMISSEYMRTDSFRNILVRGEVTNYNGPSKGHYYFSLKDERSLLPCRMWKSVAARGLKFELEKGQDVGVRGNLEYYPEYGTSSLIAREIINLGEGEFSMAFLKLKAQLESEGFFDPMYKKPIPPYPKKVGILTSSTGAVIRDICAEAKKRDPYVQLVLYDTRVQGKSAVETIVKGIKLMDRQGCDTLIIGRGGGSDEEIKAYNDEAVVRAVFDAETPIISAVGHETHVTLIDLVADLRAWTPTAAAEEALPDVMTSVSRLNRLGESLRSNMRHQLGSRRLLLEKQLSVLESFSPRRRLKERFDRLKRAGEQLRPGIVKQLADKKHRTEVLAANLSSLSPRQRLRDYNEALSAISADMKYNISGIVNGRKTRFEVLLATLNGLSPTAKLTGGFGYISFGGEPLDSTKKVSGGDELLIRLHDGEIVSEVKEVRS